MSRTLNSHVGDQRNIGIFAHVDAGKTTTTERILYFSGGKHKTGDVDTGDTTTDFLPEEQEHGVTIQAAAVWLNWNGLSINLIDTPGHVDFRNEVRRALRALDGMVLVLSSKDGVQTNTRTIWREANQLKKPRLVCVNKMDSGTANFEKTVGQLVTELRAKPAVLQLPIGSGPSFRGQIDLLRMVALIWDESDDTGSTFREEPIPADMVEMAARYRADLVAVIAEQDAALSDKWLKDEPISVEELKAVLRRATIRLQLVPVVCASAFKRKGVQPLLDAIVEYLPSPLDIEVISGVLPKKQGGGPAERHPDVAGPLAALAFKVSDHTHGTLTFVRVYSGRLESKAAVFNSTKGKMERASRLVKLQGNKETQVEVLEAGDIGAVIGLKHTTTGDTLCDSAQPIILETIHAPEPVISQSIEAESETETARLVDALAKMHVEDPSFHFRVDSETRQIIISGQGQFHLDVQTQRLERVHGLKVRRGHPQVSYRETITQEAKGVGKQVKQSGGKGQYGHAEIEIFPLERGKGFSFEDAITGGVIDSKYVPDVEDGVQEALQTGPLAGYPMVDVGVRLVFGSMHAVDSSDRAFHMAGILAVKDAYPKSKPILLEPVMAVTVEVPNQFMGDVMGHISKKRGRVVSYETIEGVTVIHAEVPLAEMPEYATELRSITKGQGTFDAVPAQYEPMPAHQAEQLIRARKLSAKK